MNKVSNKNKGCANKKCSPQQNGAQLNDSGPPDTNNLIKSIENLKIKGKPINGLINGTTDDKKIISNKTETHPSHVKHEDNVISVVTNEISNDHTGPENRSTLHSEENDKEKCESKSSKKSKSKKRTKSEHVEPKCSSEDCNSADFDILSIIRNKCKGPLIQENIKEVVNNLENLDINKELSPAEEESWVKNPNIEYIAYQSELQMPLIMKIIQKDLSEPYSIYTYRYFIHNWPNLCFLAMCEDICVGAIVCKLDMHRKVIKRGYIAMLAVDKRYRKHGIGSTLVKRAIQEMITGNADEVVLETEITNKPALRLYEALGFVRDKRLFRYYLNGVDALRLKLWLR